MVAVAVDDERVEEAALLGVAAGVREERGAGAAGVDRRGHQTVTYTWPSSSRTSNARRRMRAVGGALAGARGRTPSRATGRRGAARPRRSAPRGSSRPGRARPRACPSPRPCRPGRPGGGSGSRRRRACRARGRRRPRRRPPSPGRRRLRARRPTGRSRAPRPCARSRYYDRHDGRRACAGRLETALQRGADLGRILDALAERARGARLGGEVGRRARRRRRGSRPARCSRRGRARRPRACRCCSGC